MNDIKECLDYIDADDYKTWLDVGMALKNEGYSCSDWEAWSRKSAKYKSGECEKKWRSFSNNGDLKAGTIVHYAEQGGYTHKKTGVIMLDYDDFIQCDEPDEVDDWSPIREFRKYVTTLFQDDDKINYVTAAMERDGRYSPASKGITKKVSDLLKELDKYSDITYVIGDYNHAAGVWVRFNPLDGNGVGNDNVTAFRYALVESDTMSIEEQKSIYKRLELPIAALVYSGGKSLHAIVKINADNKEDYSEKVKYLYDVCEKNGLTIDKNNKNPARLSRLPGVERGENRQYIVDTNIGKADFESWKNFIENNELPGKIDVADVLVDPPKLSPSIIDGILRAGHKAVITGPSKAGKSYLMIELSIALAVGCEWMGCKCTQGKVFYINLEIDEASFLKRIADVSRAMGVTIPRGMLDVWNLRGHATPLDKLVPEIIRQAKGEGYIAIIIDPIYKILMGDENSASDMGKFCNQFDKLCTQLRCAVIYAHHHRKGDLSGANSIDRGSGSGVIARDADAIIDLSPLKIPKQKYQNYIEVALQKVCDNYGEFDSYSFLTDGEKPEDMSDNDFVQMMAAVKEKREELENRRAYTVEMTLREFKPREPKNVWFAYPLHIEDATIEKLLEKEPKKEPGEKDDDGMEGAHNARSQLKDEAISNLSCYIDGLKEKGITQKRVSEISSELNTPESTIRDYLKALRVTVDKGRIYI